jgi:hypothetical protein
MRFEVLMAVKKMMVIMMFWVVKPLTLIGRYQPASQRNLN